MEKKFDDEFEDEEFFEDMEEEAEAAMNGAAAKPSVIGVIGAVLFGVALVGGIGYMGYRKLFAGKKNSEDGTDGGDVEE